MITDYSDWTKSPLHTVILITTIYCYPHYYSTLLSSLLQYSVILITTIHCYLYHYHTQHQQPPENSSLDKIFVLFTHWNNLFKTYFVLQVEEMKEKSSKNEVAFLFLFKCAMCFCQHLETKFCKC